LENPSYPLYTDTTSTFYPDPDAETTSVDGRSGRAGITESFYTKRTEASGNSTSDSLADTEIVLLQTPDSPSDQWYALFRSCYLYTSALPDDGLIASATVMIRGTALTDNTLNPTESQGSLNIVASNPASNTSLGHSDYSTLGSTSFGSTTYANWYVTGQRLGNNLTSSAIDLPANLPIVIQIQGTIKTGSASGTTTLNWAQATATSSNTSLLRGSYLRIDAFE
jgi:hypothetical protein